MESSTRSRSEDCPSPVWRTNGRIGCRTASGSAYSRGISRRPEPMRRDLPSTPTIRLWIQRPMVMRYPAGMLWGWKGCERFEASSQ